MKTDKKAKLKALEEMESEKSQKPVKSMTVVIEWKKSRMWGHNPYATATIRHHDGTIRHAEGFTCSGYGYDKESTVMADVFRHALAYKLYGRKRRGEAPYGMYYHNGKAATTKDGRIYLPSYNGGVGMSCYYYIAEFIGGGLKHTVSTKTVDVYEYTDKRR